MKMNKEDYARLVKERTPNSKLVPNMIKAFLTGGAICCVGQGLSILFGHLGLTEENAAAAVSITLIFIGAVLTGAGVYDNIAKHAGAGTLVPITGFSNSVVSPALEFKSEGYITGMAAKMFVIAGPVLVFGTVASVIYGLVLALFKLA